MSSAVRHTLAAAVGLAAIALSPVLAQEYKAGPIKIEAPWIRATPAGAEVAAGYLKIENTGKEPDRLIGGSTAIAGKFEIHEMKMQGTVMKMRELPAGLEVKPGRRKKATRSRAPWYSRRRARWRWNTPCAVSAAEKRAAKAPAMAAKEA